jgi:hypothetical protein
MWQERETLQRKFVMRTGVSRQRQCLGVRHLAQSDAAEVALTQVDPQFALQRVEAPIAQALQQQRTPMPLRSHSQTSSILEVLAPNLSLESSLSGVGAGILATESSYCRK